MEKCPGLGNSELSRPTASLTSGDPGRRGDRGRREGGGQARADSQNQGDHGKPPNRDPIGRHASPILRHDPSQNLRESNPSRDASRRDTRREADH